MKRKEYVTNTHGVKRVIFQPGNGTRYDVIIVDIEDRWFVAKLSGWKFTIDFSKAGMLYSKYFQEVTGAFTADAAALLALIHEETGIKVVLPEGFDDSGLRIDEEPGYKIF